jgi:hypothetical protein
MDYLNCVNNTMTTVIRTTIYKGLSKAEKTDPFQIRKEFESYKNIKMNHSFYTPGIYSKHYLNDI